MKRLLVGGLASLLAASVLALPAKAQTEIRISTAAPASAPLTTAFNKFKQSLEAKFPGQLKVSVHPASALFRQGDRWSTFKVVNDIAHLTPVTVGRRNDTLCEITEGIAEGDTVVIHPSDRVMDGVRVREL